jgi:tetratricopeptide (TPR) repeat protein
MAADVSPRLDRYIAGELPREQERDLAQAALDDPDLFDALMAESAARAAIRLESGADRARAPSSFARTKTGAALLAAAAAVTIAVLYPVMKGGTRGGNQPLESPAAGAATAAAAAPVLFPEVLTAPVQDLAGTASAEFRSAVTVSRAPKTLGAVTAVEGGEAEIALGALDGIVQGAELDVARGGLQGVIVSRLRIDAVFRERSRGRVSGAEVRVDDAVLVPPTLALPAVRQRAVSLLAAGDAPTARAAAEQALPYMSHPGVRADDKRTVLTILGALERRAGEIEPAIAHLGAAVDLLAVAPLPSVAERTDALTEFGAALLAARKADEAERALREARQTASLAGAVRVLNDLGAAAAMRGDRSAAAELYQAALHAAGDAPSLGDERRAIAKNLADLGPAR